MATPAEKLGQSLKELHALQKNGIVAIRSSDLSRTHRVRLVKNGFLQEIIRGWYIPSSPTEPSGESTIWYASFWDFCEAYLNKRFGKYWCLSPEQSLLLHTENWAIPKQLLVRSEKADNKIITLPFNTSLLIARLVIPPKVELQEKQGLKIFSLSSALISCSPQFFIHSSTEARIALSMIKDASELLPFLLEKGQSTVASRLIGAFRNIGNNRIADNILKTMQAAGYDIRENDPFQRSSPTTFSKHVESPAVKRLQILWQQMRNDIITRSFNVKSLSSLHTLSKLKAYLHKVDEIYAFDAYHSLSIEGYQVSEKLIEKVKNNKWNPDKDENDRNHRNALAARGYWQAFNSVKQSIEKVFKGENAGNVALCDHGDWYRELFAPSVTAGILKTSELIGYRNSPVYIRRSRHIPPTPEVVRDLMPAFFDLLMDEEEGFVRIVLGHFLFVYIHPYTDGNGRIGRFLMNLMAASAGYPWIIVPVEQRTLYMNALEEASIHQNIIPFCDFLITEILKGK